jgi:hypothetical protein
MSQKDSSKKSSKHDSSEAKEQVITISIRTKGGKSEVVVAQGSSNHYTDHGSTSDTCCTCET